MRKTTLFSIIYIYVTVGERKHRDNFLHDEKVPLKGQDLAVGITICWGWLAVLAITYHSQKYSIDVVPAGFRTGSSHADRVPSLKFTCATAGVAK